MHDLQLEIFECVWGHGIYINMRCLSIIICHVAVGTVSPSVQSGIILQFYQGALLFSSGKEFCYPLEGRPAKGVNGLNHRSTSWEPGHQGHQTYSLKQEMNGCSPIGGGPQ